VRGCPGGWGLVAGNDDPLALDNESEHPAARLWRACSSGMAWMIGASCGVSCSVRIRGMRFRGGLVFKAHIPVYHSTLGWRVIKRRRERGCMRREVRHDDAPGGVESGGDGTVGRAGACVLLERRREDAPVGLCYRLGGDNLSELSANYQPPANKTGTDNSPQGSLRVYPRTLL